MPGLGWPMFPEFPASNLRHGITAEYVSRRCRSRSSTPSFKRTLSSPPLLRRICDGGSTPVRWSRFLRCHYVCVGVGLGGHSSSEEMQNSVECLTEKIHEVAHSFFANFTPRGHDRPGVHNLAIDHAEQRHQADVPASQPGRAPISDWDMAEKAGPPWFRSRLSGQRERAALGARIVATNTTATVEG